MMTFRLVMISDCPIKRPPKKEKEEEEDEENTFDKLFTLSAKEVTPLYTIAASVTTLIV